jgi:hypothetical protein
VRLGMHREVYRDGRVTFHLDGGAGRLSFQVSTRAVWGWHLLPVRMTGWKPGELGAGHICYVMSFGWATFSWDTPRPAVPFSVTSGGPTLSGPFVQRIEESAVQSPANHQEPIAGTQGGQDKVYREVIDKDLPIGGPHNG